MKLKIECDTEEEKKIARDFLSWLSNSGEQDYWTAIEYMLDSPDERYIRRFNYDPKKPEVELVVGRIESIDPI